MLLVQKCQIWLYYGKCIHLKERPLCQIFLPPLSIGVYPERKEIDLEQHFFSSWDDVFSDGKTTGSHESCFSLKTKQNKKKKKATVTKMA